MEPDSILGMPVYVASSRCGYCLGKKTDYGALKSATAQSAITSPLVTSPTHASVGTFTEGMTCELYDRLINMGFRRSGDYLYKNDPLRSCCRMYTIRTNLGYLKMHKGHRKSVNRFVNTIAGSDETHRRGKGPLLLLWMAEQEQAHGDTFYTKFEPADFSQEKYELYKRYQVHVHNDDPEDVDEDQFKRFLCTKPFTDMDSMSAQEQNATFEYLNSWVKNYDPKSGTVPNPKKIKPLGAIHESYYLKGKLIAISVLDFLPTGVSSIYFIWDPDYAHLSLGTLSGLRDIFLCHVLDLGYYYLGFYIADCVKMKYKLNFGGEILDTTNQTYFPMNMLEEYTRDGKLVCIEDAEESGKPVLNYGERPKTYAESNFNGKKLKEVSVEVYGDPNTYTEAMKTEKEIFEFLGINDIDDSFLSYAKQRMIPLVVPGFGSLEYIKYWALNGKFDDIELHLRVGRQHFTLGFEDLRDTWKWMVINTVRAYGFDILQHVVLTANM